MKNYFFGDKNSSLKDCSTKFSTLNFFGVKQTHSDICITYEGDLITDSIVGDAIIAKKNTVALYIKTADCMPILIQGKDYIAAVHAGWRGVENNILIHTINKLYSAGEKPSNLEIKIGPHIQQSSFEISEDVLSLLLESMTTTTHLVSKYDLNNRSSNFLSEKDLYYKNNEKYFFNLKKLIEWQMNLIGIISYEISSVDTKTHEAYHSFRRDHAASGRNISYIF